nr:odorant receptor 32 [Pachyrhinus yasumatsui]
MINGFFTYAATMYNITTHMALVTLLMYASSQLEILQYRLKHYISDDFNEEQMDKNVMALKRFIKEHQYIIEFTKKINKKCKNIVMMEYILSSFDAASVTISITRMELSEMLWLCAFLVLLVIQIFCLAWSCNEVNLESQAVADAAFESRWRLLNKEGKQVTQIMIQQAQQRPLMMTIGPFGPMTMQSFLTIWKAAYSYLSIMK